MASSASVAEPPSALQITSRIGAGLLGSYAFVWGFVTLVAVLGTAAGMSLGMRKPWLTYRLLDKQPRLTVSTMGEKRDALLAGIGVGTMPLSWVEEDLKAGRLKVIGPEYRHQIQVVLAWRRDTMGKAKSWLVREIPKLFPCKGE